MRRLTLILSDLYLSEEPAQQAGSRLPELPALEWLLRVSDQPRRIADWRAWLAAQLPGAGCESVIFICTSGLLEERLVESAWFATPVHLEARLDHVRLASRGLLRLDVADRTALREEFARDFGPPLCLHDGGERNFYLSGLQPVAARTLDPARLLGGDIAGALPGKEAIELRRLGSEIEMWLHGASFNAARQLAGKPPVSSLWLWRGAAAQSNAPAIGRAQMQLHGGDPLILAINRHLHVREPDPPSGYAGIEWRQDDVVVELAPVCGGSTESLPALEQNWFAPARVALLGGALDVIEMVANDRVFRIASKARWRFWRRQHPWLARLGGAAKA
jgi:hypothetical protein